MQQEFVSAFAHYMTTGDNTDLGEFCEQPAQLPLLAVYRNGFYKSCVDALAANFSVCQKFLGEDYFRQVAREYVDQHPPKDGTLVGYGENFPELVGVLSAMEPDRWHGMPLATRAIATLDRAWLSSLMSTPGVEALTSDGVAKLANQGRDIACEPVRLNSSVRLCELETPVFEWWAALKTDTQDNAPIVLKPGPQTVMFWRLDNEVTAKVLSAAECVLMHKLKAADSQIGAAFEAAIQEDPAFDVGITFTAILQNQLLETVA